MTERSTRGISGYARQRKAAGRVRKILLLALLVLLVVFAVWSALYYQANRRLPFPAITGGAGTGEAVLMPGFLYAISGPTGPDALEQPVGVAVAGDDRVFVVDGRKKVVRAYTADGDYLFSFDKVESPRGPALKVPGRVLIGPDGNVWVTDRSLNGIFIFSPADGSFIREFDPGSDLLANWEPLAIAFNDAGELYVCDVSLTAEHRVVAFDAAGVEFARWGSTMRTDNIMDAPSKFHYPNGIAFADNGDVYVSDMSNRRVQIFTRDGQFKDIISTSGSPLGLVADDEERFYVVDPFAHGVDIYDAEGKLLGGFGGPGLALGKFQYPSDIALDEDGRIFVSDRENNQVQVWGWPTGIIPPIEIPEEPAEWAVCLSPLLLLLIPIFRRRTAFLATPDFLDAMIASDAVPAMDDRRFKWIVTEPVWARYADRVVDEVRLEDLLDGQPYSETDVRDLMERASIDQETAITLTMAQRIGRLASEDAVLATAARELGIRVFDRERFLEQHAGGRRRSTVRRNGESE